MIIRSANVESDALSIIDGARAFSEITEFKELFPSDNNAFIAAIGRIMVLEGMEIILAEHETRIVGGIGILLAPFLWNPEILAADELFWWAYKNAPFRTGACLIDEAMKRIDKKGAIPMFRVLENSPKGVEKLYRRKGMKPIETMFARI